MAHGKVEFLVVAFLALSLLSGCLTGHPSSRSGGSPPFFILDGAEDCDPVFIENCDDMEDPLVPYRVRALDMHLADAIDNLHADGKTVFDVPAALQITRLDRDVVVASFRSIGYPVGIMVDEVDCPDCTITINDAVIMEDNEYVNRTGNSLSQVIGITGIDVRESNINVVVENTRIFLREHQESEGPEDSFYPESIGINVDQVNGSLGLKNIDIGAPGPTRGAGIKVDVSERATLQNITVSDYSPCIRMVSGQIEVSGYKAKRCGVGLGVGIPTAGRGLEMVAVEDFQIEDAESYGIVTQPLDPPICPEIPQMVASHLIEESEWSFRFSNGLVRGSGTAGIRSTFAAVSMERVAFIENGHNPHDGGTGTGGILSDCLSTLSMVESIIEGNHEWGARVLPFDDVRYNWWGHPSGPSLEPTGPGLLEGGDRLGGSINYLPFLTERPDFDEGFDDPSR